MHYGEKTKQQLIYDLMQINFQASLLDQIHNAVIATNLNGEINYWNNYAELLYLWKKEEVIGKPVFDVIASESNKDITPEVLKSVAEKGIWESEYVVRKKDGSPFYVYLVLTLILNTNNEPQGFLVVSSDITNRKKTEADLVSAKQHLMDIIDFLPDATFVVDINQKVIAWNRAMEEMTGVPKEAILDKGHYSYSIPFYGDARPILIDLIFESHGEIESQYDYVEKKGNKFFAENFAPQAFNGKGAYLWATASPLFNNNGNLVGAIETIRDISERKKMENQLKYLATHDSLTNVPNRHSLEVNIKRAVGKAMRGETGALMFIDLDNFKMINDTLGHGAGDEFIISLTRILNDNLREGDMLFRFGGDEFAVLLEGVTPEEAINVAERLRQRIDDSKLCLTFQQTCFNLTISIGVVMIDGTLDTQKLLAYADTALYAAKEEGRNKVIFIRPDSDITSNLSEINHMITKINNALKEEGQFVLLFQPVISINSKKINHYEILLRLKDKNGELIMPHRFIPVAERFGLMPHIDQWVFQKSLQYLKKYAELKLSINISGVSLGDRSLLGLIKHSVGDSGIKPSRISFEITETAVVKDLNQSEKWIKTIKGLGCNFALDDFGIGFSSFLYLRMLPVDYLKIDGTFIRDIKNDYTHRELVRAINSVANTLGKKTIAEFVENEDVLNILKNIGVDYAQGYYVGKPTPYPNKERNKYY